MVIGIIFSGNRITHIHVKKKWCYTIARYVRKICKYTQKKAIFLVDILELEIQFYILLFSQIHFEMRKILNLEEA